MSNRILYILLAIGVIALAVGLALLFTHGG